MTGPSLSAVLPPVSRRARRVPVPDPSGRRLSPVPLPPTPEATLQLSWADVLDAYLEHLTLERRCRPSTIHQRDHLLRTWQGWLALRGHAWHEATATDLGAFLRRRSTGAARPDGELAAETHAAGYQAVQTLYAWAHSIGLLAHNPVARVRRPRLHRLPPRALSRAQIAHIMRTAATACRRCAGVRTCVHALRWHLAARLAYHAGLRAMEIAGLRWEEVQEDAARPWLYVRDGKGGQPGRVALARPLARALADARPSPGAVGPVLTRSMRPGDPAHMTASAAAQLLGRLLRAAGVEESGHALRHSLAAHLEEAGVPVLDIMRILRHSSLAITSRYLEGVRDRTGEAVDLLDGR